MEVQVWSDVVCPWCYIGKRRLDEAIERFAHAGELEVRHRSFELDPGAPAVRAGDHSEHLARKSGISVDEARESHRRLAALGAEHGLTLRFDIARGGNTFDAHRLLHLAYAHDRQAAVKERLFAAYFTEGAPIGERDTVQAIGVEAGLDAALVAKVLGSDSYAADVRADEQLARDFDITGVPFFVIDGRYAVAGAQRADVLLDALEQAWSEKD